MAIGIYIGNMVGRSSSSSPWTPQMVNDINLAIEGHSFVAIDGYGEPIYKNRMNAGSYFNGAVGGTNIAQMVSRAAVLDTHLIAETAFRKNVLLLWSGVNDVTDTVGSGTTAYNAVKPFVQNRGSVGWRVLFCTMVPAINVDRHAQYEIERNAFNTLVRNDLSLINNVYILDTDTIAELNAPADVSNLSYFEAAGLHILSIAHWLVSDLLVAQIINMYSLNAIYKSGSVPADGHTVGWYIADDLTTITKDGSNLISAWNDKLGSGHNLLATTTQRPTWSSTGVQFNGIGNTMAGTFAFAQPEFIYIVAKVSSTSQDYSMLFNGSTYGPNSYGYLRLMSSSPVFVIGAGSEISNSANLYANLFVIFRILFKDVSSKSIINMESPVTGDSGITNMDGFRVGASNSDGGGAANMEVKEIILRNVSDSPSDEESIYNYLKRKYML